MISVRHRSLLIGLLLCLASHAVVLVAQVTPVTAAEHQPGIDMYRRGDSKAAAAYFESLVNKNKKDETSLYYLGLSLASLDKLKDASKHLENAVKLRPDFARASSALSYVYMRRNKNADALKYAERALRIELGLPEAHYVVGIVRLRSRSPLEALKSSEEAIKLAPEMANAHLLRSMALISVYTLRVMDRKNFSSRTPGATPTPDEPERRLQARKEGTTVFSEAAKSLETYLRLKPNEPLTSVWRDQLTTLKFYATALTEGNESQPVGERLWLGSEVTTKAIILEKPEPAYTDEARNRGVAGTVVLRAVFSADGKVRHILILAGLPDGLTEVSVAAARRIRFVPATVNGVSVSMGVQLEYNFNLF